MYKNTNLYGHFALRRFSGQNGISEIGSQIFAQYFKGQFKITKISKVKITKMSIKTLAKYNNIMLLWNTTRPFNLGREPWLSGFGLMIERL